MRYFNELEVIINSNFGSGFFIAQNVTLDINRNINSTYVLGRKNSSQVVKTKENESTVEFSYFIEKSDPILSAITYVRTGVFSNSFPETNIPLTLKIAGISGVFYPTRYSLAVNPNSNLQATAFLTNYSDLSGQLSPKPTSNPLTSGSGIAHSWNTILSGNGTFQSYNVLTFDYDVNVSWNPIYSIGQRRPGQIDLSAGQETFQMVVEDANSDFTVSSLSVSKNATFFALDFAKNQILSINTSGSEIDSSNLDLKIDDYAQNKLVLKRTF